MADYIAFSLDTKGADIPSAGERAVGRIWRGEAPTEDAAADAAAKALSLGNADMLYIASTTAVMRYTVGVVAAVVSTLPAGTVS
jgi:hypothetical protein